MWLIVGLGNPGSKYRLTRHNIGFMAIDRFLSGLSQPPIQEQFSAEICKLKMEGEDLIFAKPQTFMNLSGESVQQIMSFYKIDLAHLLVIHDDIDLPLGQMRFHKDRGAGGQNGIKSIHEKLGTQDYARLKLGIGRPDDPRIPVADYVLQKWSETDMTKLPEVLDRSVDAMEAFVFEGLARAADTFNRKS